MKNRCSNQNSPAFKWYGARGISVCERWESFENFATDMASTYWQGASIERVDNDGDYYPENCKWIPRSEQAKNRRTNHVIVFNGDSDTIAGWGRRLGIRSATLNRRLRVYGMEPSVAFQNKNLSGRKSKALKPYSITHSLLCPKK